jgi:hypothetical protein
VLDGELDWFILRKGQYEPLASDEGGVLKSEVFPGLWLDRPALLRGDLPQLLQTLHRGLSSPGHQAFVARLTAAQGKTTPD